MPKIIEIRKCRLTFHRRTANSWKLSLSQNIYGALPLKPLIGLYALKSIELSIVNDPRQFLAHSIHLLFGSKLGFNEYCIHFRARLDGVDAF